MPNNRKAEPYRIAHELERLADRAGYEPAKAEARCPLLSAACVRRGGESRWRRRRRRTGRLLEIEDERFFEGSRAREPR